LRRDSAAREEGLRRRVAQLEAELQPMRAAIDLIGAEETPGDDGEPAEGGTIIPFHAEK